MNYLWLEKVDNSLSFVLIIAGAVGVAWAGQHITFFHDSILSFAWSACLLCLPCLCVCPLMPCLLCFMFFFVAPGWFAALPLLISLALGLALQTVHLDLWQHAVDVTCFVWTFCLKDSKGFCAITTDRAWQFLYSNGNSKYAKRFLCSCDSGTFGPLSQHLLSVCLLTFWLVLSPCYLVTWFKTWF